MDLDFFRRCFCVNLDRRTDRWAEAVAEFDLCGLAHYERVAAVETRPNGNIGCTASHRIVWGKLVEAGWDFAVVFEDDFKLLTWSDVMRAGYSDATHTVRIFRSCPGATLAERWGAMKPCVPAEWDLLYLGGGYECRPLGVVDKYVIRNAGMKTTHAYAISQRLAARMLEESVPGDVNAPDTILAGVCKDPAVLSYTLSPRLFVQRPGTLSDLNPQPPGFPFSMTDSVHEEMVGR